ncbi:phospholipid/cholesterol/gamma-HCH transport system substrate-binding protein [Nocardioides albertanoniae]|uniref:Phospholipid/cholesterol/gamma-HCH transport system substrate-binding protein n=1 Tax=Nocardioides albertanoniae TaxID=1175486 RepID=A0A543A778_9ACTN|nr:MlaD family protein [Nocardioides albertanoniae]TQL68438.1 phospholipid/cholesterol/gamma-HCH transport system substrate-binding protein [Nocardioides albertanoniae]
MNKRDLRTAVAGTKLAIFTVVSVLVTATLASIMGNVGFGDRVLYRAEFSTASGLGEGDDVRVAGITVGEVLSVDIEGGDHAMVSFRIDKTVPLTSASGAQVRYLNLVGDRYLALTQDASSKEPGPGETTGATSASSVSDSEDVAPSEATPLRKGQAIAMSNTTPALDLTELFNGFQPLFQALQPKDVNKLSLNLIRVLQGEGGTIASLLSETASLTSALAERDQLIGDVITNLSKTLSTVNAHHAELADLIKQLSGWMKDLARDKEAIGDSISSIGDLTDELAGLLTDVRPFVKKDIKELKRVVGVLNKPDNQKLLDKTLERLPETLESQARIGSYGSWYNYYLCDLDFSIKLPSLGDVLDNSPAVKAIQKKLDNVAFYSRAERCKL